LIDSMDDFLPLCTSPVQIVQGDNDPIVSFRSAQEVMNKLGGKNNKLKMISSNRHGILHENIGGTWESIDEFMKECIDETNAK
jgi:alpha-beta hydrolase superfamily lysophospholipase